MAQSWIVIKDKFEPFLNKNKKVKLIFVISPEIFEDYVIQDYRFRGWSSLTTPEWKLQAGIKDWVDQYALKLSLDPLISSLHQM